MSDTEKNIRDRLGLWGLCSESEVPGSLSGLNRLKSGRYSKVCKISKYFYLHIKANFCFK